MHCLIADMAQQGMGSVAVYTRRAEALYDENLSAYVKLTTRRFFAKLIVSSLGLVPQRSA
jgi:exocyst complex component 1